MSFRILVCALAVLVLPANGSLAAEGAPQSAPPALPSPAAPLDPDTVRLMAVSRYFALVSMKAALTRTCAAHVDVDALPRLQAHILALPELAEMPPVFPVMLQRHVDRGAAEGTGSLFPDGPNATECARMMAMTDDGLTREEPAMRAAFAEQFAEARLAR